MVLDDKVICEHVVAVGIGVTVEDGVVFEWANCQECCSTLIMSGVRRNFYNRKEYDGLITYEKKELGN